MAKYVVLRESELGRKEYDYFEKPLFFDTKEEAEAEARRWHEYLADYPANGGVVIATIEE